MPIGKQITGVVQPIGRRAPPNRHVDCLHGIGKVFVFGKKAFEACLILGIGVVDVKFVVVVQIGVSRLALSGECGANIAWQWIVIEQAVNIDFVGTRTSSLIAEYTFGVFGAPRTTTGQFFVQTLAAISKIGAIKSNQVTFGQQGLVCSNFYTQINKLGLDIVEAELFFDIT
ncbi:hypothetical protein BpHYR1_050899 [Brachionus plicatilis]|uniref:Uncharacterized protein n=1 Tax=Brachionus plicatilis TaxID=10195 RepID=A0A3M7RJI4_BRAPC|nr:hypothetical protein BpHYR1_050899 [Brachionus plicatilis]